jgi:hypothetical protein
MKRTSNYALFMILLAAMIVLPLSGCFTITTTQPSSPDSVTTAPSLPVIQSFTAGPDNINAGEQSQLSWNVTGAVTVSISPGIGTVGAVGTASVNPATTTTYTLTAENQAGTKTANVTVNIIAQVARPDLIVTDIYILADSLYFTVQNIGNAESKGNRAYLYINDVYTSDTYTNPLKPGEEKTIVFNKFTWPYQIEKEFVYDPHQKLIQYVTKVCVDTENDVPETDESNNCHIIIMGSKFKYDFVEYAHLAPWSNSEGTLTFPTPAGNFMGAVFTESGATMEDGRSHSNILATYPQPVPGGYISGRYAEFYTEKDSRAQYSRPIEIPVLCRFTAAVGFKKDASPAAKAKFTFSVIDDAGTSVLSREIIATNDGKLDNFDVDLSGLAGDKRSFVLRVDSLGEPGEDQALWVDPIIFQ